MEEQVLKNMKLGIKVLYGFLVVSATCIALGAAAAEKIRKIDDISVN